MEQNGRYRPTPHALLKLSDWCGIPQRKLVVLTGAVSGIPADLEREVLRFAAESESVHLLTLKEQRTLGEFVKFLRGEREVHRWMILERVPLNQVNSRPTLPWISAMKSHFTAEHAEIAERTIRIKSISALSAVDSTLFIISGAPKGREGLW